MTQDQANFIVFSALVGAILVGIFNYIRMIRNKPKRYTLKEHLGKLEWNFSTSWATNVTIFGALLCTILGSQFGGKLVGYAGISLFFGILVVISPFLYNATTQPCLVRPKGDDKNHKPTSQEDQNNEQNKETEHHGLVWAFLVSSILTLWAVFGQLETIWSLLSGPTLQNFFTPQVTHLFQAVIGLSILLVIYFGFTTIFETVREQVEEDTIYAGTPNINYKKVKEELKTIGKQAEEELKTIGKQAEEELNQIKHRRGRKAIHPL